MSTHDQHQSPSPHIHQPQPAAPKNADVLTQERPFTGYTNSANSMFGTIAQASAGAGLGGDAQIPMETGDLFGDSLIPGARTMSAASFTSLDSRKNSSPNGKNTPQRVPVLTNASSGQTSPPHNIGRQNSSSSFKSANRNGHEPSPDLDKALPDPRAQGRKKSREEIGGAKETLMSFFRASNSSRPTSPDQSVHQNLRHVSKSGIHPPMLNDHVKGLRHLAKSASAGIHGRKPVTSSSSSYEDSSGMLSPHRRPSADSNAEGTHLYHPEDAKASFGSLNIEEILPWQSQEAPRRPEHHRNQSTDSNKVYHSMHNSATFPQTGSSHGIAPDWDSALPPPHSSSGLREKPSSSNISKFFGGFGRRKRSKEKDGTTSIGMSSGGGDDYYGDETPSTSSVNLTTPGREQTRPGTATSQVKAAKKARRADAPGISMFSFNQLDSRSMEGIVKQEKLMSPQGTETIAPISDPTGGQFVTIRPGQLPGSELSPLSIGGQVGDAAWAPPDSWAVQPAIDNISDSASEHEVEPKTAIDAEYQAYDRRPTLGGDEVDAEIERQGSQVNYCIRIFRADSTFVTISCGLYTNTHELMQLVAKKFFLPNTKRHNLFIKRYIGNRILTEKERPLLIQKRLLEQAGYTDADRLEDLGREDNSYLVRFYVDESSPPTLASEEEAEFGAFEHVDLSRRNFQTIPIFLYRHAQSIISLNLSRNSWLDLPSDFVQLCGQLRELRYSNNDVRRVPPSIKQIPGLTHLDLSSNRLDDIAHAQLETIRDLTSLKLQNNHLDTLPAAFEQFYSLRTLDLSNNNFHTIPSIVCSITSLADLDFSFNNLEKLPEELGMLVKLERLLLVGNSLSGALPSSLSNLTALRELDLRRNKINNIDAIADLPRLSVLDFDHNAVTTLEVRMPAIVKLNLVKNPIITFNVTPAAKFVTDLDLSFAKLSNLNDSMFEAIFYLENLVLDHNQLMALPKSIGNLQRLVSLSCVNNSLQALPSEIGLLDKLEFLDAHYNNIRVLPSEIWNLKSLRVLNVSSNLLESFPSLPGSQSVSGSEPSSAVEEMKAREFNSERKQSSGTVITVASKATNASSKPPPPLIQSLRKLYMADNRLNDDVFFSPMSLLSELRVLNLSCNDLYEIPSTGLEGLARHPNLEELYLSCNQLATLPADDIERLGGLRVLHLNGNKLQTLPAELGKIRKLLVLDVGNNSLKYNISNWPYDWNWNWNLDLKYLNLSGNKRLEIKPSNAQANIYARERNLSDFSALTKLRILGLMDVTLMSTVPDESEDRRIRTSASEVNNISYGMADTLGKLDHLAMTDVVVPRFRGREDEALFAMFDGRTIPSHGNRVSRYLYEWFSFQFNSELSKLKPDESPETALRRTFVGLDKDLGTTVVPGAVVKSSANSAGWRPQVDAKRPSLASNHDDIRSGASACVVYLAGTKMYVANVGSALAIVSSEGNPKALCTKDFGFRREEAERVRAAGGFLSSEGLVNGEIENTRGFGHFDLMPIVNASPHVMEYDLSSTDEFIVLGNRNFWEYVSFDTAIDVARRSRDDLMMAAQKLRDFAIAYGADESVMVMVVGIGELFDKRSRSRGRNASTLKGLPGAPGMLTNRRGGAENVGDSTLARLGAEVSPPVGIIAIAFTDIQNSTLLWESNPSAMRAAMRTHNAIMRRLIRMAGGYEVKTEGDAFIVSFQNITSAILWAFQCQLALMQADWPQDILEMDDGREVYDADGQLLYRGLRVRMGIHYGAPDCEEDPVTKRMDYFGPMVNRAARISAIAEGGQICASTDLLAILKQLEELFRVLSEDDPSDDVVVNIVSASGEETSVSIADIDEDFKRDVLALKKMGLHIKEIGERKLKGLEAPEYLAFLYCNQMLNRRSTDEKEKRGSELVEPTVNFVQGTMIPAASAALVDAAMVRSLGYICVRLERVAAMIKESSSNSRNSTALIHPEQQPDLLMHLINIQVKEASKNEHGLLKLLESLVMRIENSLSTLQAKQMGGFSDVLSALGHLINTDPDMLLRALQAFSGAMGEGF